jgi:hypothetical protein
MLVGHDYAVNTDLSVLGVAVHPWPASSTSAGEPEGVTWRSVIGASSDPLGCHHDG